ncbi:hypothetical protein AM588_10008493 [Phytophthora nicotianae]|uniref:HMA domain-containing protein n=1 Tax=Phytophthora nicotianae TaxID=4792 RepID=A0A0W8DM31_PHYNI|nr:hypothetical protein AM588_10008493 [Phytophthora nicotianae]
MVVSEDHQELLPLVHGVQDGACVPAAEDVPSVTSSHRRDDEERVVFLVVPGLAEHDHAAAGKIETALKRSALGVRIVQLDLLEKLARIELLYRADEEMEAALADEVRRATPDQLVAYPVWQHRERIVRLRVDGMRCMTNCGRQVIRALEQIPGVLHIHVDSKSRTAEVALAKGCTATEVDLIKYIRAANPRFNASIAKEKKERTGSVPGAILLNITGMSCAKNCATKVQAALQSAEGVIDATVDFSNKRATIILEPESKVTEEDLVQVVRSAGTKFDASRYELFNNDGDSRVVYLMIEGMSCAKNCARKVQDALNGTKESSMPRWILTRSALPFSWRREAM